jgi:hypothetical protein
MQKPVSNRRFEFPKRRQLFIRAHNEPLTVAAMCVSSPDCSSSQSRAKTHLKLQPALLSLSAIISQYYTRERWSFAQGTAPAALVAPPVVQIIETHERTGGFKGP